jgi:hypothetical protein
MTVVGIGNGPVKIGDEDGLISLTKQKICWNSFPSGSNSDAPVHSSLISKYCRKKVTGVSFLLPGFDYLPE